jgi:4'-phosphopantetheinyl transferase
VRDWRTASSPPSLGGAGVHVWRIHLADARDAAALRPILSAEERARADRFYREEHRVRFAVAHGWLRLLLARYLALAPDAVRIGAREHGKPYLVDEDEHGLRFNLSHSGDLALVAVARTRDVGVDLEQWDAEVEHLELAERFFSPIERDALRALPEEWVTHGFFNAWSRKEAYLKATGHGITRGLHHFDVSLAPEEEARLLHDRLDGEATSRWTMRELAVAPEYSAALVTAAPLESVELLEVASADIR